MPIPTNVLLLLFLILLSCMATHKACEILGHSVQMSAMAQQQQAKDHYFTPRVIFRFHYSNNSFQTKVVIKLYTALLQRESISPPI